MSGTHSALTAHPHATAITAGAAPRTATSNTKRDVARDNAGFVAQEAALRPGGAVQMRQAPPGANAGTTRSTATGLGGSAINFGVSHGTMGDRTGVSHDFKSDVGLLMGATDADHHTWESFDDQLAARAGAPRDNAAYGEAEGFAGLQGEAEAHAGIDGKHGHAEVGASVYGKSGLGGKTAGYADASYEGMLRDGKVGAGGSVSVGASLVDVGAEVHGSVGGGPAIGAIDPVTGKRQHLVHGEAEASAGLYVGASAGAGGEVYTSGLATGAAGHAEAEIAERAQAHGSAGAGVDIGGVTLVGGGGQANGQVEARAGAAAEGEASLSLLRGAYAKGSAGAEVMARASGDVGVEGSLLGMSAHGGAKGKAEAGATANANGAIAFGNPANMGAYGKAEAFAGARAEGSLTTGGGFLGVDIFTATISGSVAAGAGIGASGGFMVKDGVLTIDLSLLAAAGLGGSLGGNLTVDFLAPFKMLLRMLEVNGVISSNPEAWLMEIVGIANDTDAWKERMEGGFDRATTVDNGASADGLAGASGHGYGYAGQAEGRSDGVVGKQGHSAVQQRARQGGGDTRKEADVRKDLGAAHGLATEAGVDAQKSIGAAMTAVMKGAANPLHLIEAILKGAWNAIKGLVTSGVQSAIGLASSIAGAAMRTISSIAKMIWEFVKALLSGKKPDFAGDYEANKRTMDALFERNAGDIRRSVDVIKTQRVAEASAAIQSGFMELGMAFVAAAGGGLQGAAKKSQQAKELAAKASSRPVEHADGSVSQVDSKARNDTAEVGDLVGKMAGTVSSGKDVASSVATKGASAVKSAESGLAKEGAQAGKGMHQSYTAPVAEKDAAVKQKKQEGEAKWNEVKGKR